MNFPVDRKTHRRVSLYYFFTRYIGSFHNYEAWENVKNILLDTSPRTINIFRLQAICNVCNVKKILHKNLPAFYFC